MKNISIAALLFMLVLLPAHVYPADYVPGELIVRLGPEAGPGDLGALNRRFRADKVSLLRRLNAVVFRLGEYEDVLAAAEAYREHPDVKYAEPNFIAYAHAVFPDDPLFEDQWYLDRIGMPGVWTAYRGSPDIIVSVVDTGAESSHPDLAGRLVAGYNFVHDNLDTGDDNGHGTYIAGIIGAEADNGFGIAGINWDVSLMPVKSLDMFGAGAYSDVAAGIIFSADNGAAVINLSLGGKSPSFVLEEAVRYARDRGCVLVASTGNSNEGVVFYPAAYRGVIAVGASNEYDERASEEDWGAGSGSNYGPEIDLLAPGTAILSTFPGGGFAFGSGTSASAAVVSGVSAILLQANPDLRPGQVRWIINSTAENPGGEWDRFSGHGLLNAAAAVDASDIPPGPDMPDRWPFMKPPRDFFRWANPPVRH